MGREARAAARPSVPWFFILSSLAKKEAAATPVGDFKRAAEIRRKRKSLSMLSSVAEEAQAEWQSKAGRLVTRAELATLLGRSLCTIDRHISSLECSNAIQPVEAGAGRRPALYDRS